LNRYLERCSAPPDAGAAHASPCRALIVGLEWEAPAHRFTVGSTSQRGLFLQDRIGFGSTLSSARSANKQLVRVPGGRALVDALEAGGHTRAVTNCTDTLECASWSELSPRRWRQGRVRDQRARWHL